MRCRRENKQCVFSLERRKKKAEEEDADDSEYEIVDGGKRRRTAAVTGGNAKAVYSGYADRPLTPGGSAVNRETITPGNRSGFSAPPIEEDEDPTATNRSTMILQTSQIYSQSDALELLVHAAHEHHRGGSVSSNRPIMSASATPNSQGFYGSPHTSGKFEQNGISQGSPSAGLALINGINVPQGLSDPIIRTWSRFRFVRAGWFRAEEGMAYIQYFYRYLYPLTPLTIPNYEKPASHIDLLEEEPMLALTILTIASRYMQLPGPGGVTRGITIHQRLNDSMHKEINRTIWGQKQFGGGFCRAGARPIDKVDHLWETLGVIEALMLLTEWHPRAMHFPPDDDDGELLVPENPGQVSAGAMGDTPIRLGGAEGRRVDSWLEPCWRSDRMCWLLLGIADALAWEIGVYDDTTQAEFRMHNPYLSNEKVQMYFGRKNHLKELLPLFKAQTSGRLELTANSAKSQLEGQQNLRFEQRLIARIKKLGLESNLTTMKANANYQDLLSIIVPKTQDLIIHFWSEAIIMLDSGNQRLYRNRKHTRQIVDSGKYSELIVEYKQWLHSWLMNFELCNAIPEAMRFILRIEYDYSRAFLTGLALQAVVQRCARNTPLSRFAELATSVDASNGDEANGQEAGPFTPADYRKFVGSDSPHIVECIEACRNIFRSIINVRNLDYLRHCPVRTYFRIISAALILIKTFVIGATEDDMATTLSLLDEAMSKLRNNIVDDVHVGNRFTDMCDTLTRACRSRLIRMNREGGNAVSRAETPAPNNRGPSMMPPPTNGHATMVKDFVNQDGSAMPGASGRSTPNPALWGISNQVYAPTTNDALSYMPPPVSYYSNGFTQGPSNMDGTMSDGYGDPNSLPDWLTLPFEGLIGGGGEIGITPNGPSIGGDDMLDKLLWNISNN